MNFTIEQISKDVYRIKAQIMLNGKRYTKSRTLKNASKKEANRVGSEMVRKLEEDANADSSTRARSLTYFKDCIAFYESKKNVKRGDQPYFKKIREDLGHVKIEDMRDAVETFVSVLDRSTTFRGVPYSGATKNRFQAWIRAILNHAVEWEKIEKSPLRKIQKYKEVPRDRVLTQDQVTNLFEAIEEYRPYLMPIVLFALQIPCRSSELINAKRFDVDLKAGYIRIRSGTTKNGNGINKPIPVEMLDYFKSIPPLCPWVFYREENGKYFQLKGFATAWRFVLEKAGIENFRFHDLRHCAVTSLLNSGISERKIMAVAGWKTNMMAVYYSNSESETVKEVQNALTQRGALIEFNRIAK